MVAARDSADKSNMKTPVTIASVRSEDVNVRRTACSDCIESPARSDVATECGRGKANIRAAERLRFVRVIGVRVRDRQAHRKLAAFADSVATYLHAPAMQLCEILYDRKANAEANSALGQKFR